MIKNFKKKIEQKPTEFVVQTPIQLMDFLIQSLPKKNKNNIKTLLKNKGILVDGKPITKFNFQLKQNQTVTLNPYFTPTNMVTMRGIHILHEDNDIIVIFKDAGVLSIATNTEKVETAYSMLKTHVKIQNTNNKIFIVHRLDRETSGVMIFAKTIESKTILQSTWNESVLQRTYIALVEGEIEKPNDTIASYLREDSAFKMFSSQNPSFGEYAITHYKTLKRNRYNSLLQVELETGKKNQIRVHLQDIGHSIVGDKKYGARTNPMNRLGLHALTLEFTHPISKKIMKFETGIPKPFLKFF